MKIKKNNRRHSRESGFTLIELMVVAVLFIMMTGLASATFRHSFSAFSQERAIGDFVHLMSLARERAVLEGTRYGIQIRPSDNAYFLLRQTTDGLSPEMTRVPGTEGKIRHFPESLLLKGDVTELLFYPNGTATPASWEAVQEDRTIRIEVDPVHGKGRVLDESPSR